MQLRLIIACAVAAVFIAGCSGGGNGSSSMLQSPSNPSGGGMSQSVTITLDRGAAGTSSAKRNAKFVGAGVNDVSYAFVNSLNATVASGDVALTNCASNVCTVTISAVPVGTYTLTITLNVVSNGTTTPIGTGTETGFQVSLGGTNKAVIQISPLTSGGLAGPVISIPSSPPAVFYADGESTQKILASVNEVDPVGNPICGSSVPQSSWPGLTVSATPAETGVSIPLPTMSAPPTCSGGVVEIDYSGNPSPVPTSVAISVRDGVKGNPTSSVSIPFVSISNNASSPLSIIDTLPQHGYAVTVTEVNGFYAGETGFTVSGCNVTGLQQPQSRVRAMNEASPTPTPAPSPDVTVSGGTFSQGTSLSPNSTQTFDIVGAGGAPDSACSLVFTSSAHGALTTSVSLTIAPSVGVTIEGKMRSGNAR